MSVLLNIIYIKTIFCDQLGIIITKLQSITASFIAVVINPINISNNIVINLKSNSSSVVSVAPSIKNSYNLKNSLERYIKDNNINRKINIYKKVAVYYYHKKHINFDVNEDICKILSFKILDYFYLQDYLLDINFISSNEIKNLNYQFRNKNTATDILSFSQCEFLSPICELKKPRLKSLQNSKHLGDLVICLDQIFEKSTHWNLSYSKYLIMIIIHGILHLGGHDHKLKDQAKTMNKLEKKAMNMVLSDPILQKVDVLSIITLKSN